MSIRVDPWSNPHPDTDELHLGEETFKIVGCAMEVLNTLGPGLNEKPYENALAVEFRLAGIPFKQQPPFPVFTKGASSVNASPI